jgi:carbon monoxide dehydrogenase subunit G
MQNKQTKTFQVKDPIAKVWKFLSDPRKVAPCLPGAQITQAVDDRTFKGTITVKIGPVSTSFKGEVKILRKDEEQHELELSGTGQDPRGGGGATMKLIAKLTPLADGGTEVTGTNEVTVTGKLAQFGGRMMDDVSNLLFQQFTKSFQERLAQEPFDNPAAPVPKTTVDPEPAKPATPIRALPLFWMIIKNALRRLFGGRERRL